VGELIGTARISAFPGKPEDFISGRLLQAVKIREIINNQMKGPRRRLYPCSAWQKFLFTEDPERETLKAVG
jgi:hypothetical protein